jgi:hypothetical protein
MIMGIGMISIPLDRTDQIVFGLLFSIIFSLIFLTPAAYANHLLYDKALENPEKVLEDTKNFIGSLQRTQPWACAPGDLGCATGGIGSPQSDMCKSYGLCNDNENPDGTYNTDKLYGLAENDIATTQQYFNCVYAGGSNCYLLLGESSFYEQPSPPSPYESSNVYPSQNPYPQQNENQMENTEQEGVSKNKKGPLEYLADTFAQLNEPGR